MKPAQQLGEVLAVIWSDQDLHEALRARADALNVTRDSIDREARFTPGHASKLLAPKQIRRFGGMSRYGLIGALRTKLVLVVCPEREARLISKLQKRRVSVGMLAVKNGRGKHRLVSKRFLRKIAPRGADMRNHNLSAGRRSAIARKAAKARWRKPKLTEVKKR